MKETIRHPELLTPSFSTEGLEEKGEIVSIYVDTNHPLLQLKRGLPWEAIQEVMVRRWRAAGKNVDGRPGQYWDVSLYVPVIVLMCVKHFNSREMEAYLAENVVARVFISRHGELTPQIRDHSNIARAYACLGAEGMEEVNALILKEAVRLGFGDPRILSGDTTVQELPIGYPNEPGILRGIAQRCLRALGNLKKKGVQGVESAIEKGKTVLHSVKEHHLFAKAKEEKEKILTRLMEEMEHLMEETTRVVESIKESADGVKQKAIEKLTTMKEVATQLIPQIIQWMKTGVVAKGKILHAGLTQARAIIRNKAGKKVEFGLKYLINRIDGGYLFGSLLQSCPDETKMPLQSLSDYRKIFGQKATPELIIYDRGGYAKETIKKLAKEGVEKIGIQPKGKGEWLVVGEDRERVKSERGKMEGSIGTLKTEKYGFNKPKERNWEVLQGSGQESILSLNLNKFMKDLVNSKKTKKVA
jgi:hypothetical protein